MPRKKRPQLNVALEIKLEAGDPAKKVVPGKRCQEQACPEARKPTKAALRMGVARAHKTLKNLKSAWVENQQIILDDEGQIKEYRVQLKITFVLED